HGANDPRVPLSEAEQIRDALAGRGVDCELRVYEDEGHGLAKRENRQDAYPAAIEFLQRHLGRSQSGGEGGRHRAKPPSLLSTWPVIQAPSSLTSQAMSRAGSSGCPIRPKGNIGANRADSSGVMYPVSTGPGFTVLTVIPASARCSASVRVMPASAALDAAYATSSTIGPSP